MSDPALSPALTRDPASELPNNGHTPVLDSAAAQALARRAAELETVAKVSAATATILEPKRLLQEVVDLAKAQFELYHAHIYLLNAAGDALELAAGAGDVGHRMVAQGWRIPFDREHSLVARTARTRRGLLVNDVRQAPDFLPNVLLPDTRAEMAVPMLVGDQLLGVLDVQSAQPGQFSEQDITIQTILATQVAVALQNARQHEQTQRALADSDRQRRTLQAILNNVPVGVFVTDAKTGMPQLVNQAGVQLLGRGVDPQRAAADSAEVYPIFTPGTDTLLPVQDLPVVRTMSTGAISRGQLDIQQPEGRITAEVLAAPIRDANGEMVSVVALYQDVTERRRHERELRRSRERYELVAQSTNDGLWDWDMAAKQVYFSPRWKSMLGYAENEIGSTFEEYTGRLHPDDAPVIEQLLANYLAGALPAYEAEIRMRHKDGSYRWILTRGKATWDSDGRPFRMAGSHTDITERKQAEDELRRFRLGIERTTEAVFMTDTDGRITYANPAFERVYGYTREEVLGQTPRIIKSGVIPQEGYKQFWEALIAKQVVAGEIVNRRKDGRLINIEGANNPIIDEAGQLLGFLAVHRDITERKQIEERQSLQAAALAAAANAIVITDLESHIEWVNPAFTTLTGYTFEEAVAGTPRTLKSGKHDQAFYANLWGTVMAGNVWHGEIVNRRKDDTLYTEEMTITPVRDAQGQIAHFVAVKQDVTARRESEVTLAKRAAELEVVAQVGMAAVTITDPLQLLQSVADLTQSSFKLYHANIYMLNDAGDLLELTASSGEVGQQLVAEGWRIALSADTSLVAQAARTRQAVVVNDTLANPDFLPNARLPETRAEMAIPIVVGERTLGVLDVQAADAGHFTADDVRLTTTLAAQVAVALQNVRQFAQAQRQAEREALVNTIGQQIQSATTVESALQIAARELGRALKAQRTVVQLGGKSVPDSESH